MMKESRVSAPASLITVCIMFLSLLAGCQQFVLNSPEHLLLCELQLALMQLTEIDP